MAFLFSHPLFDKNENYRGNYEYSLKEWKGKSNVLLIFAPHKKNGEFQQQLDIVKEQFKFFKERNAVLYFVFEDEEGRADDMKLRVVDGKSLRKRFKIEDGSFSLLAVNKKGDAGARKSKPQSLDELKALLKK